MWNDPIVEEVRAVRTALAQKFICDLKAIAADLKKQQKNSKRQVVSLPSKKPVVLPRTKVDKEK
jgi:hypothetical protein